MIRGAPFFIGAAACTVAACASGTGAVQIRALAGTSAAAVDQDERLAEANAQLALGNAGLALELYRKHLRSAPDNLAARVGMATCYDRMGRFDLSRPHYEAALAQAPANTDILEQFAASLDLQGLGSEANEVRAEIRLRADLLAGSHMPDPALAAERLAQLDGSAPAIVAASVTVTLPAADPVSAAPAPVLQAEAPVERPTEQAPAAVAAAAEPAPTRTHAKARLVRLSSAEVVLVSPGRSAWRPQVMARSDVSTTVRFVPLKSTGGPAPNVRLLNAARTDGLASRTRGYLLALGWRRIAVGDAPEVRQNSLILYPKSRRRTAEALAAQFGIPVAREAKGSEIVMLLGRDASGLKVLQDKA